MADLSEAFSEQFTIDPPGKGKGKGGGDSGDSGDSGNNDSSGGDTDGMGRGNGDTRDKGGKGGKGGGDTRGMGRGGMGRGGKDGKGGDIRGMGGGDKGGKGGGVPVIEEEEEISMSESEEQEPVQSESEKPSSTGSHSSTYAHSTDSTTNIYMDYNHPLENVSTIYNQAIDYTTPYIPNSDGTVHLDQVAPTPSSGRSKQVSKNATFIKYAAFAILIAAIIGIIYYMRQGVYSPKTIRSSRRRG
jgi:hypothetical protein